MGCWSSVDGKCNNACRYSGVAHRSVSFHYNSYQLELKQRCTGFDTLMPEGRSFPWKYIPKLGCKLSITFGEPLLPEEIKVALRGVDQEENIQRDDWHSSLTRLSHTTAVDNIYGADRIERVNGGTRESISTHFKGEDKMKKIEHVRSMVTAVIQRGVEALGRRVQGDSLGKKEYP